LSDPKMGVNIAMKRVLLDLYTKSGEGDVLRSSAYSDKDKNTKTISSPALTILGESTPSTFYAALSPQMISEGLMPRFSVIEYTGDRPDENPHFGSPLPENMQRFLAEMTVAVLQMMQNNRVHHIGMDLDAADILHTFNRECDQHIRESPDESFRELWNRAHLKALRLSGLLSIGHTPLITRELAEWAINLVRYDISSVVARFTEGKGCVRFETHHSQISGDSAR
jgi:hypothetical protein